MGGREREATWYNRPCDERKGNESKKSLLERKNVRGRESAEKREEEGMVEGREKWGRGEGLCTLRKPRQRVCACSD